jgi:para-aminobenzoate synthetase/4-amino-4-deoxychorismate lyase
MMMAAAGHTVKRIGLDWDLSEIAVARLVRGDARPFALIGRWAGGGALIGSEPVRIATAAEDPFALLDQHPLVANTGDTDEPHPTAPVGGGWIGYLGYGLGRRLEPVAAGPPSPAAVPEFALGYYDHMLRRDADGRWWFEALWCEARAGQLADRLRALQQRAATPSAPRPFATTPWRRTPGADGHERAVDACRTRIHAGDLFQANICVRLESELDGDPLDLFLAGVEALQPDRAAFLSGPWGAIASLSPELFLERRGRHVRSAPIKGTVPKPSDPGAAARARETLRASAKDRAENVMIVDLVRNDLGRVCRPGTVSADVLAEPRAHTGVWHLVSEVSGTLASGAGNAALVRAAFPPGSVTGAPKVAALGVIAELESTDRHAYTGAIGFASPLTDRLELSVAIRTFEFSPDGTRAWLGVGGGIVADSEPAAEGAECLTKAAPLLDAIGARVAATDPPRTAPEASGRDRLIPARRTPQPTPRPDPAAGVFETLLAEHGYPVALEGHLARLAESTAALYDQALPADLATRIRTLAAALTSRSRASRTRVRVRVNARPAAGDATTVRVDVEVSEAPVRTAPPRLATVVVPGGIGAHKWIDRGLIDALTASVAPAHPVICDLDGSVLETSRANVFAVIEDGTLVTPPADGRILPGVTRGDVLELAARLGIDTEVRPLDIAELIDAAEVFVTGSLSGIEPAFAPGLAHEIDRTPTARNLTETLRTNLYKTAAPAILR